MHLNKLLKAMEMDVIDSWKGKIHLNKLLMKENMEKTSLCTF